VNGKDIFIKRRSVNHFNPAKALDNNILKEIINLAVLAPSSFNLQPWEIIVIKSEEYKKRLYDEACKQKRVLDAPVTLAIIGNTEGFKRDNPIYDIKKEAGLSEDIIQRIIKDSEEKLYPTREKKVAFAVRNASLFAMSIMYAAKIFDVDTHPMIGFNEDKVKEIFNIANNKTVVLLISMGYRNENKKLRPREKRFRYKEIAREF
jgi:nitroreductase